MSELQIPLVIGNIATEVDSAADGNCWSWSAFLRAGKFAALIKQVNFNLHPTFRNPIVKVVEADNSGCFKTPKHQGWGVFEVKIEVYWNSSAIAAPVVSEFVHMLDFGEPEASRQVQVTLKKHIPPAARAEHKPEPRAEATFPASAVAEVLTFSRQQAEHHLQQTPFLERQDPRFFHGRLSGPELNLTLPDAVWKSDKKPREGSAEWLTATEFQDKPEVLATKVGLLATLLQLSQRTVAYTGAGISVPAGIGQAAVGSAGGNKTVNADPTYTHHTMAALNAMGCLHGWVQQNHDGLPQKAGYPQEAINEIHGSWFDPSNPVVLYSGTLRSELCEQMVDFAETSDLTIVMGTSLTGLNADQVAKKPAKRSLRGQSLGTVIISPQQTEQDGKATLRIFAKADDVMKLLSARLGLQVRTTPKRYSGPLKVAVPYDERGARSCNVRTWWNLEVGQRVRISQYNNIEGAGQPSFSGITDKTVGEVLAHDEKCCSLVIAISATRVRLGLWWLEAAARGAVEWLPVVNHMPQRCVGQS
mmetsp:Transcript_5022/g.11954  ORF Transcript_5022/g.11954 Transcript_5022/m.11954 type:complete len:531 (+) Transcript_5022:158-1750(+)